MSKKRKGIGGFDFDLDEEDNVLENETYEHDEGDLETLSNQGNWKDHFKVLSEVLKELDNLKEKKNLKTIELIEEIRRIRIENFFALDPKKYIEEVHELRLDGSTGRYWKSYIFNTLDLNKTLHSYAESYTFLKYKVGVSDQKIIESFSRHVDVIKGQISDFLIMWKKIYIKGPAKPTETGKEGTDDKILEWKLGEKYS